jgi:bacteriorhodopsin
MPFVSTVFLLIAVVAAVLIPIWVGHALSVHSMTYALYAVGAIVVATVSVLIHSRLAKSGEGEADASH